MLEVQSNGFRRIVVSLEFLQQALSKLGNHMASKRDDPILLLNGLRYLCRAATSLCVGMLGDWR